jgi:predicted AAA+ superfamily ATPase
VVIDEVQKVPALLDEVHWLIENFRSVRFALCGSSARKLKRGGANLLGGRAIRKHLFGLSAAEIGSGFDLARMLNQGYLPRHYSSSRVTALLDAYVSDYLKEEIAAEGLVRNLPVFSSFLPVAALSDAELVNFSTIARECGTSSHTIQSYFSILVDTYQGSWLPAFRKRPKRRVIGAPKFYFSDVGTVNYLAKRKSLSPGSELFGKAFENWIHHELRAYLSYKETYAELSYWRLASGIEVDFVINDMEFAIEAKASSKIHMDHLRGLRELKVDHPRLRRSTVVCLEPKARRTEDGIEVLPYNEFVARLWSGELLDA